MRPYGCNRPTIWTWATWWWLNTLFGSAAAASYACGLFDSSPTQRSPQAWGDLARVASDASPGRWPSVSLWQGTADEVVNPANLGELVKQWTNVLRIDYEPDSTKIGEGVRREAYADADGTPRLETHEIMDFAHALPVDPGEAPEQCGTVAPFIEDADVCGTLQILKFWGVAP